METLGTKKVPKIPTHFSCKKCDYNTCNKTDFTKHLNTIKHNGTILEQKKPQKAISNFSCEKCDYNTCNKKDYTKHINTIKHKSPKSQKKSQNDCDVCGKTYVHQSGLWKHKQTCVSESTILVEKSVLLDVLQQNKELNKMMIDQNKQNLELQEKVIELCKNGINNTINSNNVNSHNKTFNLQFFLNETCKDAINIMDFVNSIQLQLSDLENVGKVGYVEGISNIITTKLNLLEENQRPIHCTDVKRETLYVKDENKWTKENENKTKIRKVIKSVANKNIKLIPVFKEKHPDYNNSDSDSSDKYQKMMYESMGGDGDDEAETEDKIIKNISKEVIVSK
jgi:hypothetical protein